MSAARGGPDAGAGRAPLPNLAGAPWLTDTRLRRVVAALEAEGGQVRVVGGAVRDALIGRPVGEVDLATTVEPEDVRRLAGQANLKAVATGIEHGTVTVIAGHRPYEVTTLRRDVSTDGRRAVVAFTSDWAEDAVRRDFTVNALYASLDGTIHDPAGGYDDVRDRTVRFIGDAPTRIREDYLRILRFFRFHAEIGHGAPDPGSLAAAVVLRDGLAGLSRERVRQEIIRLIVASGAVAAVDLMAEHGVLAAIGLAGADTGRLKRLAAIEARLGRPGDAVVRLAALAMTEGEVARADELAGQLRLSNEERRRLAAIAPWGALSPSLTPADRRELVFRDGQRDALDRVLMAWAASDAGADDQAWADLADFAGTWRAPLFPVRGDDLAGIGIARGPGLGAMLRRLERVWLERDCDPGREALLDEARKLLEAGAAKETR